MTFLLTVYIILSYNNTKLGKTEYKWDEIHAIVRASGAKHAYSAIHHWLKYWPVSLVRQKAYLSKHFVLSTLFFYHKAFTVTRESTERKFLKCFPDQRCHGECIWLGGNGRKVQMTRRLRSDLCVIWKQLISRTQLAHFKPTHLHEMYEIFPNKRNIQSSNHVYCGKITTETWLYAILKPQSLARWFFDLQGVTANR